MGFFRGLGRMVKPLVNVPKWMGAKQISKDAGYIKDIARTAFTPAKAKRKESFADAVKRLNLSDEQIKQRYIEFRRLSIIFGLTFITLFSYFIYLLIFSGIETSWRAIALSAVVCILALVQFLRFNYWMYQIKQRKLGCSFKEYFYKGILGIKS